MWPIGETSLSLSLSLSPPLPPSPLFLSFHVVYVSRATVANFAPLSKLSVPFGFPGSRSIPFPTLYLRSLYRVSQKTRGCQGAKKC